MDGLTFRAITLVVLFGADVRPCAEVPHQYLCPEREKNVPRRAISHCKI